MIDYSVMVLYFGDGYGIVVGCLVNFVVLDVDSDYEVVCW